MKYPLISWLSPFSILRLLSVAVTVGVVLSIFVTSYVCVFISPLAVFILALMLQLAVMFICVVVPVTAV